MQPRSGRSDLRRTWPALVLLASLAFSCAGRPGESDPILILEANAARPEPVPEEWYHGPPVLAAETGPARFVPTLLAAIDGQRAMETVRALDRWYRAPANEGYEASLDYLEAALREAGFGEDARLELAILESAEPAPAWTPRSARLALLVPGQQPAVLHAFDTPEGVDRVMLPVHAPSCSVCGPIALSLDDVRLGDVLVTEATIRQVSSRAAQRGAAAVVSASLEDFNADPSGADRHLDAVQFRMVPPGTELPSFQISPRSLAVIRAAREKHPDATLELAAEVAIESRKLRTLAATVVGAKRPDEAVVTVSHVQEPGACDNASGVAGLLESAAVLAGLLRAGTIDWPDRSVVFVWGDEFRQSEMWLAQGGRRAVAGISSDMTGESFEKTGAKLLLERMPDPGALVPLPPDEHTPWGKKEVKEEDLVPNGLAIVARCAIHDVGRAVGGWRAADHPWEGGSDHDVFIKAGIPAALFWHFTDFAYHTSLDRIDHVDPDELGRTAVALLATGLALADPKPADLDRYLLSLRAEERLRTKAATESEIQDSAELAERWKTWCLGARMWLRELCLGPNAGGIPPQAGAPPAGA